MTLILESQVQKATENHKDGDVAVIILFVKNPSFKGCARPFDLEICGKKMWKYVELAVANYELKTTFCTPETDVISCIKPMLNDKTYTLVLFSDTPLISLSTVEDIVAYAKAKQINAINLPRGYIFNTNYLKTIDKIQTPITTQFGTDDFFVVDNPKAFAKVSEIVKNRILDFHMQNGVILHDTASIFIGADCIIESGVEIFENNSIGGKTFVAKGVKLFSGNRIENCIIKESSTLQNCFLSSAKIERESILTNKILSLKDE